MNLAVISMIRNEGNILNVFVNHLDALFDSVYLIDHRSIDGMSERLDSVVAQRGNWKYISLEINGYYQKEISSLIMRHLFGLNVDCVFFLDCDEFVQIKNREELEKIVKVLNNSQIAGSIRWVNCVPDILNHQQFHYESAVWKYTELSQYSKMMIPRSVYNRFEGNISLSQGNHQILDTDGKTLNTLEVGTLIHVPVRSRNQMIQKTILTSMAHLKRENKQPGESYQFKEMLKLITSGELSDDWVRGCINLYQKASRIVPISKIDLTNGLYQKTSLKNLKIASTQAFSFVPQPNDPRFFERSVAEQILSWEDENPENLKYDEATGKIFIQK
jgi:hypothetical protein